MQMARHEVPNNTPEQVHAYIEAASALVDQLDIPEERREAAFLKAIDLIAAKQLVLEPIARGGHLL